MSCRYVSGEYERVYTCTWTLLYCNAGIDIAPRTQHANISDSATFYCRAKGANTRWIIESLNYRTENHTEGMGYVFGEIIVGEEDQGVRVHDLYLEIPATVENNGTQIQCLAYDALRSVSDPVFLIVQGKFDW